jgi:hypothetical protein
VPPDSHHTTHAVLKRGADTAEQHRIQQQSLIQQARASDIAERNLSLTLRQAKSGFVQTLATVMAFVAACFAGWAAYRAYRAAEDTLSHARNVADAELRPYVFTAETNWHYMNNPANADDITHWRISVVWKNSGQTPARRIHISSNHESFGPDGLPRDFNFPDKENSRLVGSVGPGQFIIDRNEMPLADFEAVYQKEKRKFFWCWLEYDGNVSGKRYRTECCYEIIVSNDPTIGASWRFMQATLTDRFNGPDETCQHQPKT